MRAFQDERATQRIVVPDLDDELHGFTEPLDEALRHLAATIDDPEAAPLPAILAGPGSEAFARSDTRSTPRPRSLLGPDGRYEHEPIRVVEIDHDNTVRLGSLLGTLRRVVYETGYAGDVDEYLNDFLSDYAKAELDSGQALELLARFHGVIDLDNSAVLAILDGPLERARTGLAPVVSRTTRKTAYRRLRDRWNADVARPLRHRPLALLTIRT